MTEDKLLEILAKLIVILDGNKVLSDVTDVFKEMLRYKNIEEELGIDLATLFKALFEGAWFKDGEPASFITFAKKPYLRTDIKPFVIDFFEDQSVHYLKDYGRTWALTKDELL